MTEGAARPPASWDDDPRHARRAAIVFAALIAAVAGLFALCAAWEPIQRDGWFHFCWHRDHTLTGDALWRWSWDTYLRGNPRLGQVVTFLSYQPSGVHRLLNPLWITGTILAVTALVLGRWPSPRRRSHVEVLVVVAAMVLISVPSVGEMFCYRPILGNYVFGFFVQLLVLVPYRRHAVAPRPRGLLFALLFFVGAVLAGMTNEHTGPAAIAMVAAMLWWFRRRGDRWAAWMFAGLIGLVAGFLLLLFAPGQDHRYAGLATQQSLLDRVRANDLHDILVVFGFGLTPVALILPWLLIGGLVRSRRAPAPALSAADPTRASAPRDLGYASVDRFALVIFAVGGAVVILTLLASPKQGWRLVYAPAILWIVAAALWLRPRLYGRTRTVLLAVAAAGLVIQGLQLLRVQRRLHVEFTDRLARLRASPPGAIVALPSYSLARSPWFLGDEIDALHWRRYIAWAFDLTMVSPSPKPGAPALVLEYRLEPPLTDRPPPAPLRIAPADFGETRQACLALGTVLGGIAGHRLLSATYRFDGVDRASLGGRPILACAHRAGQVIEPRATSEVIGFRTWRLRPDLVGWQPSGPIDMHVIAPSGRLRPAAAKGDTYEVDVTEAGLHRLLVCDPAECFLAGTRATR